MLVSIFVTLIIRDFTKISSLIPDKYNKYWWGIKQLGISFGSIFLLFSYESSQGPLSW